MSITTIVIDFGGVLFREGKSEAAKQLAQKRGYKEDIVLDLLRSPKSIALRQGRISDGEFWNWAQAQLPKGYITKYIKDAWYDGYILDNNVCNLLKKLHNKYALIAFSDNIASRIAYLKKKYDFEKYFDLEIYSYEYSMTKRDRQFYNILIEKSGKKPQEMIYIDDTENALRFAQALGIHTILYEHGNIGQLEKKLQVLGVII